MKSALGFQTTVQKGKKAEEAVCAFLLAKGWKVLCRNFRSRSAELDIVALDGTTLVFVEVKQRSSHNAGFPEEAVTAQKITKLYEAARYFLKINPQHGGRDCRFDVVALDGEGSSSQLRHLINVATA